MSLSAEFKGPLLPAAEATKPSDACSPGSAAPLDARQVIASWADAICDQCARQIAPLEIKTTFVDQQHDVFVMLYRDDYKPYSSYDDLKQRLVRNLVHVRGAGASEAECVSTAEMLFASFAAAMANDVLGMLLSTDMRGLTLDGSNVTSCQAIRRAVTWRDHRLALVWLPPSFATSAADGGDTEMVATDATATSLVKPELPKTIKAYVDMGAEVKYATPEIVQVLLFRLSNKRDVLCDMTPRQHIGSLADSFQLLSTKSRWPIALGSQPPSIVKVDSKTATFGRYLGTENAEEPELMVQRTIEMLQAARDKSDDSPGGQTVRGIVDVYGALVDDIPEKHRTLFVLGVWPEVQPDESS